ncbi:MAG: DinB family protein [Gemmatimonadaceae bacterium]
MPDRERIAALLERSVRGPMWHGPSLHEALASVSAAQAAAHPIDGAHSVWELVLHITAWADIARERLASATAPPPPSAERNYPPVRDTSEAAWRAAIARLEESHLELARDVRAADAASLYAMLPGRDHTAWSMLHGIVEHDTYHGGQLAMLARAAGAAPAAS